MIKESDLEPPIITKAVNAKVEAKSLITEEWETLKDSWKELDTDPRDR